MLGAEKSSVKVGLNDTLPKIFRHIGDPRPARDAPGKVRHDVGIIDVHIDLAEAAGDLIDHSLYALFVANVDMHREGFACCAKLGGCFFARSSLKSAMTTLAFS